MEKKKKLETHWRDSARFPKFFMIDARVCFPIMIFLLHMRWWTFKLTLFSILVLSIMNYFRITPAVLAALIRQWIGGNRKVRR